MAERGRSQVASQGLIWRGLVRIAFWSKRILFGVPRRVIGSGFDGGAGVGAGSLCGSGASGNPGASPLTVADCWTGFWAETWLMGSRNETVRHRNALNLGGVTGIDKFGRQLSAPCWRLP